MMKASRSRIFVFGSNLAGRHGRGAALFARLHKGAVYGQGVGLQGNSYAVPTKDEELRTLGLPVIAGHVCEFLWFARANPNLQFDVTRVGCGLANYKNKDIAPLFASAPENCLLPKEWEPWCPGRGNYRAVYVDADGEEAGSGD